MHKIAFMMVVITLLLSACGQNGALYLPDHTSNQQVTPHEQ